MRASNWIGQTLSERYRIEQLLGQGGMSAVYKATDPNLKRTVAIKLIHPHLSDNPDFVRRFEEEAAFIAQLRHQNIVQVFDFNHDGDLYYMVLEFLSGETLKDRIKRCYDAGRCLTVSEILKISIELCEAVNYAHQRGMIHRDIKPANIMLDVNGHAILMDFGIAKLLGGQQHTATGAVVGTAMYMSPEQIQGLHPDGRADLYSIGVALYEMVSGRPPFEADSAMTLMMMHLNDPVPNLRSLRKDVPEDLLRVIERCLAKKREDRFQSAEEMLAALRRIQDRLGQAVPAPSEQTEPAGPNATMIEAPAWTARNNQATAVEPAVTQPVMQAPAAGATIVEMAPPPQAAPSIPSIPSMPLPAPRQRAKFPILWIVLGFLALACIGGIGIYFAIFAPGNLPIAFATSTPETVPVAAILPTETQKPAEILPTETIAPTATATETLAPSETPTLEPSLPVIGGADMIAFIYQNDIWTAQVDGEAQVQLSKDGAEKTYLRWLPDGDSLSYISGKCVHRITLSGEVQPIACFNNSDYLESFEVSPDGQLAAISMDHQLSIVPYDLTLLNGVDRQSKLTAIAGCADFAPYTRNWVRYVRWSSDSQRIAAVIIGVLEGGIRGDIVQVFSVAGCYPNPKVEIAFPPPHFTYGEYQKEPSIESLAWNGDAVFIFNSKVRNEGFGNLIEYNMQTYKAELSINPVNKKCCYRDAQWSPDGNYLLVSFQDQSAGSESRTQVYLISYASIGTNAQYTPLPLPETTDPHARVEAVMRPVQAAP